MSDIIFIMQFGIFMILGFMVVLVLFYISINTKSSKNSQSTINIKYKNNNTQNYTNEINNDVEEENDPIKNL